MIIKINEKTKDERTIGELLPDIRVFRKQVWLSRHLYQKLDAFGIDAKFFTDVLYPACYDIEVFDNEEKRLYKTTADIFKKNGEYLHFKINEIDHNSQIFLSRRYWQVLSIPKC